MQRRRGFWVSSCVAVGCIGVAMVANAQFNSSQQDDTAAVRAAAKEYLLAVRRGDGDALRKMWAADGDYVDSTGRTFKAQDVIPTQAAKPSTDTKPATVSPPESSLRFASPDVAIEDGSTIGGTSSDGDVVTGRFTAVWVKRNGKWLLASLRDAVVEAPSFNEHLQPLDWLVGEWVGSTDNAVVLVSSQWSDGGNFIVRDFLVRRDNGETVSGSERIGWDAANGQIKSWTFDSQGGAGENQWRRDGKGWLVTAADVAADGAKSKTSGVYTPGDDGRFVWESAATTVAGTNLPARRIEFSRAPDGE